MNVTDSLIIGIATILVFIYHRLGLILNKSEHISYALDDIKTNLESIEKNLNYIENNTSIVAQPQRDINKQMIR